MRATVDLNFVWTLYVNQLLNAAVKVYMHVASGQAEVGQPRQPEGRASPATSWLAMFRECMACYLTALSFAGIFLDRHDLHQVADRPESGTFCQTMLFG